MPRGRKNKQAASKRRQATAEASRQTVAQGLAAAAVSMVEAAVEAVVAPAAMAQPSVTRGKTRAAKAKAEVAVAAAIVAVAAAAVVAAEGAEAVTNLVGEKGAGKVGSKLSMKKASPAPASLPRRSRGARRRHCQPEPASAPRLQIFPDSEASAAAAPDAQEGPESTSWSPAAERMGVPELPVHVAPEILSRKAGMLEQFLMYKFKMRRLAMKEDMLGLIGEQYQEHFAEILQKASQRIEVAFGVTVMEVDPVIHAYDLVSKLKLPNNGRLRAGKGLPKTGLLMNILGMIFMKGNRAKEEDIWKFLAMMKVYPGRRHPIFGEPRKLITKDLVKHGYLEYRQIAGSDPPSYEFLWGPKAHAETSKMQVLEFLAKINETSTSLFLDEYEEALKDEEEKSQSDAEASADKSKQEHRVHLQKNICPCLLK